MQVVLDVSEWQSPALLDKILSSAPDTIIGVSIKATQDITYRDFTCNAFAHVCEMHNTPYGYYDFMTNAMEVDQAKYFKNFVESLTYNNPRVRDMMDLEGAYDKWAQGAINWEAAFNDDALVYAQESNMYHYPEQQFSRRRWVAQYPERSDGSTYAFTSWIPDIQLNMKKAAGYVLWQFTNDYMFNGVDASILLGNVSDILR